MTQTTPVKWELSYIWVQNRYSCIWRYPSTLVVANNTEEMKLKSFLLGCLLKAHANARNIVGPNMLRAFEHHVVCCCDLLEVVGWSLKLVKLQSQQVPTFLLFRGHRSVVQQCCVRLHSTCNKVMPAHAHQRVVFVFQSFVFSSEDPTCCDLFRAFAHDRLTSRNERQHCWSQQCFVLLRAFARALTFLKLNCQHVIRLIRSRDKKLIFQLRDPSLITCRSTKFDSAFCHSVVGKMG